MFTPCIANTQFNLKRGKQQLSWLRSRTKCRCLFLKDNHLFVNGKTWQIHIVCDAIEIWNCNLVYITTYFAVNLIIHSLFPCIWLQGKPNTLIIYHHMLDAIDRVEKWVPYRILFVTYTHILMVTAIFSSQAACMLATGWMDVKHFVENKFSTLTSFAFRSILIHGVKDRAKQRDGDKNHS